MTVEEIFSKVLAHMTKGLMTHEQLANYYHFLGLEGCRCCHEYHFLEETLGFRKLQKYYIRRYNKLICNEKVEQPEVIPENWFKYTRQDVTTTIKRNAVKAALDIWYNWEIETHKLYYDMCKELENLEQYSAADLMREFAKDVEKELEEIDEKRLRINDVEFSLNFINLRQSALEKEYKKKKKGLLK